MTNIEFSFGENDKLKYMEGELNEFLDRIVNLDERPYFVSDEACLFDITSDDIESLNSRFEKWYGRKLTDADCRKPLWNVLAELYPRQQH